MRGTCKPVPTEIYVRPYWVSKGLVVWLVNERLVRKYLYPTFTEGGHDRIYSFIPHGEVWVSSRLSSFKRKLVALHEVYERWNMGKGMSYNPAHRASVSLENYYASLSPKHKDLEDRLTEELIRQSR